MKAPPDLIIPGKTHKNIDARNSDVNPQKWLRLYIQEVDD